MAINPRYRRFQGWLIEAFNQQALQIASTRQKAVEELTDATGNYRFLIRAAMTRIMMTEDPAEEAVCRHVAIFEDEDDFVVRAVVICASDEPMVEVRIPISKSVQRNRFSNG